MKYTLAIFDLDGTLLNTLDDLADSCNYVLQKFNFPTRTLQEIKSFVGNGIPKLIERALPQDTDKNIFDKVLQEFIEYYKKNSANKTRPYDGIIETLTSLKQKNILIAVNTNKQEQAALTVCKNYFGNLIDIIQGAIDGKPLKPDPFGINSILEKTQVSKSNAIYIGDSDTDILTANNSNLDFITCTWGFREKDFLLSKGAKNLIDNPKQILDFFN